MPFERHKKSLISFLAALMLLPAATAQAAPADKGSAQKGLESAHSIYLDKDSYSDGSLYDNPSCAGHIVKVGLCFGNEAVREARFASSAGGGFILGSFGEDRSFTPMTRLSHSEILLVPYSPTVSEGAQGAALPGLMLLSADGSELLFRTDDGRRSIALMPDDAGTVRFDAGEYYGGFECVLEDDGISVINYVPLEKYVKGVVPYEMSPYFPFEALRAQAVCARSYAVYNKDGFADKGFDLTDDTRSQVYGGAGRADAVTDSAVDSTAGLLVRREGEVCEIYYSSSFGGASESGQNVFGSDKPYLAGKYDPFEKAVDFDLKHWSFTKSGDELSDALRARGYDIGVVESVTARRSETDNVIALTYTDTAGKSLTVEGRRCYTMLGLHSCRFSVSKQAEGFVFSGSGWGHNCGMSQWGAYSMAQVYGYNFEDIIRFYFTGAYIA